MGNSEPTSVFLDANVLIYYLDETADQHTTTITQLQKLVDAKTELYTSHHVVEEVLYIVSKLAADKDALVIAAKSIAELPGLALVEPEADFSFAVRYVELWQQSNFGINDALLLQLVIDADIDRLFSFDKAFVKQAVNHDIKSIR